MHVVPLRARVGGCGGVGTAARQGAAYTAAHFDREVDTDDTDEDANWWAQVLFSPASPARPLPSALRARRDFRAPRLPPPRFQAPRRRPAPCGPPRTRQLPCSGCLTVAATSLLHSPAVRPPQPPCPPQVPHMPPCRCPCCPSTEPPARLAGRNAPARGPIGPPALALRPRFASAMRPANRAPRSFRFRPSSRCGPTGIPARPRAARRAVPKRRPPYLRRTRSARDSTSDAPAAVTAGRPAGPACASADSGADPHADTGAGTDCTGGRGRIHRKRGAEAATRTQARGRGVGQGQRTGGSRGGQGLACAACHVWRA